MQLSNENSKSVHANRHACSPHMHARLHIDMQVRSNKHAYMHAYINTYIHTYIHTYLHAHLQVQVQVPVQAQAQVQMKAQEQTQAQVYTYMHAHIQEHTGMNAYIPATTPKKFMVAAAWPGKSHAPNQGLLGGTSRWCRWGIGLVLRPSEVCNLEFSGALPEAANSRQFYQHFWQTKLHHSAAFDKRYHWSR